MKKFLEECKVAYYAGDPIISDSQYDMLENLCAEDLSIGTNKGRVKHWYKMYSLQKFYEGDPIPHDNVYFITPKLDGASLSLRYINGKFDSAVTRGNGEYGEDATHLFDDYARRKLNIPEQLFPSAGLTQITGEIVAPESIPNARNYAAGALNLKDPIDFGKKDITFVAYDWQETEAGSYMGTLCTLKDSGFNTVYHLKEDHGYPTDGLVYRIDVNQTYLDMGFTSKHPRGAFAVKERSEGVKTTILDVIWDTGKTGKVTPVAILEPINIDGARVARATLNNPGFIEALGVGIGDSVMVERAGGIIPRIIGKAE